MSYTITAVGEDWVEIWDGASIVDPDIPRHKRTDRMMVGIDHGFIKGDVVDIAVRLVERKVVDSDDKARTNGD